MFLRFLIFFIIAALFEIYFLQAVKIFTQDFSPGKRGMFLWIAYGLAALSILVGIASLFSPPPSWNNFFRFISSAVLILLICKILGCCFLIIDDVIRLFRWLFKLVFSRKEEVEQVAGGITRLKFLSQLAITFTFIPAISFLYGMVRGAYKYRVHNVKVDAPNLPDEFHGFRIVQISDMHTGSFLSTDPVKTAFDIILKQNADMIVFTGDLVNNLAEETVGFIEEYKKLKAPYGVYSVLGNHDYGDYMTWDSDEEKKANLDALKKVQAESGWRLLMNEHVPIEKNGQKIALLGIENWGSRGFTKYGKMEDAYKGTEDYSFKILLSHDPSNWDHQVRKKYPNIDLTLSGHTHGMQLGIEIPGFKWSPVQYIYKQWAGLYKQDNQYLYVNRGLGFLGYPGRLGIWPEITVIELGKA